MGAVSGPDGQGRLGPVEGKETVMDKNDSVLYLLQDIKELLLGIALVLFAIALILLGGISTDFLYIVGAVVLAYGGLHIWRGWTAHELIEKKGGAPGDISKE